MNYFIKKLHKNTKFQLKYYIVLISHIQNVLSKRNLY
jgi:hypothetical protein